MKDPSYTYTNNSDCLIVLVDINMPPWIETPVCIRGLFFITNSGYVTAPACLNAQTCVNIMACLNVTT